MAQINTKQIARDLKNKTFLHKTRLVWFRNTFVQMYCVKCDFRFGMIGSEIVACKNNATLRLKLGRLLRRIFWGLSEKFYKFGQGAV